MREPERRPSGSTWWRDPSTGRPGNGVGPAWCPEARTPLIQADAAPYRQDRQGEHPGRMDHLKHRTLHVDAVRPLTDAKDNDAGQDGEPVPTPFSSADPAFLISLPSPHGMREGSQEFSETTWPDHGARALTCGTTARAECSGPDLVRDQRRRYGGLPNLGDGFGLDGHRPSPGRSWHRWVVTGDRTSAVGAWTRPDAGGRGGHAGRATTRPDQPQETPELVGPC